LLEHIRRAIKVIKTYDPDLTITRASRKTHVILKLSSPDGQVHTLSCSSSPKDPAIAELRIIKDAKSALNHTRKKP
jgi:hypothetical protein